MSVPITLVISHYNSLVHMKDRFDRDKKWY